MEPARHRLEQRVRVYIFVCVLAYRLLAYLQWRLENLSDHKDVWKEADAFLHDLERVERVEIRLGHQVRIWHLNLTGLISSCRGENQNCSGHKNLKKKG
jgi:transposase